MYLSEKETDIYKKLAFHLDNLPGGFPETQSGVELKILRKLFTEDEALLACHLTLISETAEVVAMRSKKDIAYVSETLKNMADKGLIFSTIEPGKPEIYMAAQFVVGIWELQVGSLDKEIAELMDEYIPYLFKADEWKQTPQMRIVPVKRSIDSRQAVMPYEEAERLISKKENFVLTPCICRLEKKEMGETCTKPLETCISFGDQNDYYVRKGLGRQVDRKEILKVLKEADKKGLVVQPSNGKDITWICLCCGCCCGVLRTINTYPSPSELVSSAFVVRKDDSKCTDCRVCIKRCQTKAFSFENGKVLLDEKRCIGCGLCVSTCPEKCLELERKRSKEIPKVPESIVTASIRALFKRKKMNVIKLLSLFFASKIDRIKVALKKR